MKERPILFNANMVRAILDGRKTQTRRIIKDQPELGEAFITGKKGLIHGEDVLTPKQYSELCPFGKPGDRLWVRETWGVVSYSFNEYDQMIDWTPDRPATPINEMPFGNGYYSGHTIYAADGHFSWTDEYNGLEERSCWKPSIHMPRIASRILLEIVSVRVERLNDISKEDAASEGFDYPAAEGMNWKMGARHNFKVTWDSIYKNWNQNPWVWVIEFKKVEA